MSAEKVLANPLSGEEIVVALLDKLGQSLRRDCFLSPMTAYQNFSASVTVNLVANDVGRAVTVAAAALVEGGELEDEAEGETIEIEIAPAPPNQVRVETGQDVPVQTRDTHGRIVTKGVKYARKGSLAEKAAGRG